MEIESVDVPFEELKSYLEARKKAKTFFTSESGIFSFENLETLRKLKEISSTELRKVFGSEDQVGRFYSYEKKCIECLERIKFHTSKTQFLEYLFENPAGRSYCAFKCETCTPKVQKYNKEKDEETLQNNTSYFIQNYLDSEKVWKSGIKNWDKIQQLSHIPVYWEVIADYIKATQYQAFLNTPYWKAVSERRKIRANFQCQLCSSNQKLAVHHPNYDFHGYELQNINSLTVLCSECHEKHHDIKSVAD